MYAFSISPSLIAVAGLLVGATVSLDAPFLRAQAPSRVPVGLTAPAPRVNSIGGSPTTTTLTWTAAATGARLLQFEVSRWHQLNTTCCTASVVIPVAQSADASWTDYDFPLAGIYVYRIIAVYADGSRGTMQLDYTRPEPVNPASLIMQPNGLGKVRLTWPEVANASFYQLWGTGIAGTGVTVMNAPPALPGTALYQGVTQQVVDGVRYFSLDLTGINPRTPGGPWSVGSFYVPPTCAGAAMGQPCATVSTSGTDFTRTP